MEEALDALFRASKEGMPGIIAVYLGQLRAPIAAFSLEFRKGNFPKDLRRCERIWSKLELVVGKMDQKARDSVADRRDLRTIFEAAVEHSSCASTRESSAKYMIPLPDTSSTLMWDDEWQERVMRRVVEDLWQRRVKLQVL